MDITRYMVYVGLVTLIACTVSKALIDESVDIRMNVIDIKEYEYVYRIKATEIKSQDTVLVMSFKSSFYIKNSLRKPNELSIAHNEIFTDQQYDFKVLPVKPQVSKMEQLGAFVVVEKDTLWKERSYLRMPKLYTAQNTLGLIYINE